MTAISKQEIAAMPVEFKLNGKTVVGRADETIIQTAKHYGIEIPHLCYKEGMRPDGNCRACVVEIKGERTLAPSCCRVPNDGMDVTTDSTRAVASQKMVLELLLSDMSEQSYSPNSELDQWVRKLKVVKPRFAPRAQPAMDVSHPAIAVNLDACIQCTRCLRACREEQVNDVIGYAFRCEHSKIVFDLDDPMGLSTCVACGECVQACPTGALMPARNAALEVADRTVDSVCPFCGVGCQLTYHVKDEKIVHVQGRDGPANHGRLCVKGRYGFDYAHHRQRLTVPMMRKKGVPKTGDFMLDPDNCAMPFARRPGKRRSISRPRACVTSAIPMAKRRSPASGRPRARTKRPTCSRNWCAPASARTMSTIAPGCATLHRWPRCSKAWAPARCRTK